MEETRRRGRIVLLLCFGGAVAACGGDDGGGAGDAAVDAAQSDAPIADAADVVDAASADARIPPSRYYGNVPIALDLDQVYVYEGQHIGEDSNLLALPIDALGIPWLELGAGGDPPEAWLQRLEELDALIAGVDLPVYLALTPLAGDRSRLAADASDPYTPVGGPCLTGLADWATRRSGYKAYVEYLVQRFEPVFVALSIEVNTFVENCPEAWPELRALLNEIYAEQKSLRPGLPVFNTFTIERMWDASGACAGFTETCLDTSLAAIGDLSGDLFAISSYPLIVYLVNGETLPANWLSVFQQKTGLPVAIAETGWQFYPIETQNPSAPEECVEIPSSSDAQLAWMQRILVDAESLDMPFVVWWANRDYVPAEVSQPCVCDIPDEPWCDFVDRAASAADPTAFGLRFFAMMGLRDYEGTPRPSRAAWVAAVSAAEP